ncbi:hypothetical protein [Ensifer soli]|uniref:hypothetical protein n=1 Tax=Ciceribacter sp. sgz301302 TaxID=3342379 RepID=UPI0035BBBDAA
MTRISGTASAALLILQQAGPVAAAAAAGSAGDDLVAIANGRTPRIGASTQPTQAQSAISEKMFGLDNVNVNKQKLDLIDRTGKALGVNQDDYASRDDFVDAMRKAYGRLQLEGGPQAVMQLEKELGLDRLGVSLADVIESAGDPEKNDRLTRALEDKAETLKRGSDEDASSPIGVPDDIGLYGPSGVAAPPLLP